jgi:hypothetical protein
MLSQVPKVLLLVALLSAFAASSAPVFSQPRGDRDFCAYDGLKPTNCITRADGSCYTQKCADPLLDCVYSYCAHK